MSTPETKSSIEFERRTLLKAGAWAAPVVAVAASVPFAAATGDGPFHIRPNSWGDYRGINPNNNEGFIYGAYGAFWISVDGEVPPTGGVITLVEDSRITNERVASINGVPLQATHSITPGTTTRISTFVVPASSLLAEAVVQLSPGSNPVPAPGTSVEPYTEQTITFGSADGTQSSAITPLPVYYVTPHDLEVTTLASGGSRSYTFGGQTYQVLTAAAIVNNGPGVTSYAPGEAFFRHIDVSLYSSSGLTFVEDVSTVELLDSDGNAIPGAISNVQIDNSSFTPSLTATLNHTFAVGESATLRWQLSDAITATPEGGAVRTVARVSASELDTNATNDRLAWPPLP